MNKELAAAEEWACCGYVEEAIRAKYRIAELERKCTSLENQLAKAEARIATQRLKNKNAKSGRDKTCVR